MATATVLATAKTVEKFFFFWKSKSPFSQWHKADFVVDDVEFNCAEQYMMYRKASEWISVACRACTCVCVRGTEISREISRTAHTH